MKQRKIARVLSHNLHQGFLGLGHSAAAIIDGNDFKNTDPFIVLMDDRLDLPGGEPVGGPHPHAGFETVTLVLKGNESDWKTGSFEIMTAGKGIVHTEEISSKTEMHILQLWLVLPKEKRWAEPFLQTIHLESVPTIKKAQSEIRVYSGTSNGLTSPIQNQTPFTVVDFKLEKAAEAKQEIPTSYNGFIYVVEGEVFVGDTIVKQGQSAWFEQLDEPSDVIFRARGQGARFIFYAGELQKAPIISYGPFIGDVQEDIPRLYKDYREGKIPHLNSLSSDRKINYSKQDLALSV